MEFPLNHPVLLIPLLLIVLVPLVLFLHTQMRILQITKPQNRKMVPALVWLQAIPFLGLLWSFVVVMQIARSIDAEYHNDSNSAFENVSDYFSLPTFSIGIAMSILTVATATPFIGPIASLAAFVCWIIYWVQLSGHKSRLLTRQAGSLYS